MKLPLEDIQLRSLNVQFQMQQFSECSYQLFGAILLSVGDRCA